MLAHGPLEKSIATDQLRIRTYSDPINSHHTSIAGALWRVASCPSSLFSAGIHRSDVHTSPARQTQPSTSRPKGKSAFVENLQAINTCLVPRSGEYGRKNLDPDALLIGARGGYGPGGEPRCSDKKYVLGSQPAFFASQATVEAINRKTIEPLPPKKYVGFDRVSRSLRHVATAISQGMKLGSNVDPVEVQASVINGKLHVSSNFHSDCIQGALHFVLNISTPEIMPEPIDRKSKTQVAERRAQRHVRALKQDFLSGDLRFEALTSKTVAEIRAGIGVPQNTNLNLHKVSVQATAALHVIRKVMEDATSRVPGFDLIMVHHPRHDILLKNVLPKYITETMHAEQSIQDGLARQQSEVYCQTIANLGLPEGDHIIVPIAGKYVPCATCHEVENEEKKDGGVFNPARGRFILHRASKRVGMAFWNEVQHIALRALDEREAKGMVKAMNIRDRFNYSPEKLRAHGLDMVDLYSFDTDSENSASEN